MRLTIVCTSSRSSSSRPFCKHNLRYNSLDVQSSSLYLCDKKKKQQQTKYWFVSHILESLQIRCVNTQHTSSSYQVTIFNQRALKHPLSFTFPDLYSGMLIQKASCVCWKHVKHTTFFVEEPMQTEKKKKYWTHISLLVGFKYLSVLLHVCWTGDYACWLAS